MKRENREVKRISSYKKQRKQNITERSQRDSNGGSNDTDKLDEAAEEDEPKQEDENQGDDDDFVINRIINHIVKNQNKHK